MSATGKVLSAPEIIVCLAGTKVKVQRVGVETRRWKVLNRGMLTTPRPAPMKSSRPLPLKALGMAFGGFYIAGYWAYIIWFVWEYWSSDLSYGLLIWNGSLRAIVWPVWAGLALM